jgi:hypothetical protein
MMPVGHLCTDGSRSTYRSGDGGNLTKTKRTNVWPGGRGTADGITTAGVAVVALRVGSAFALAAAPWLGS